MLSPYFLEQHIQPIQLFSLIQEWCHIYPFIVPCNIAKQVISISYITAAVTRVDNQTKLTGKGRRSEKGAEKQTGKEKENEMKWKMEKGDEVKKRWVNKGVRKIWRKIRKETRWKTEERKRKGKKGGGQTGKEMSEIGRRKKRVRLDEGRKLRWWLMERKRGEYWREDEKERSEIWGVRGLQSSRPSTQRPSSVYQRSILRRLISHLRSFVSLSVLFNCRQKWKRTASIETKPQTRKHNRKHLSVLYKWCRNILYKNK